MPTTGYVAVEAGVARLRQRRPAEWLRRYAPAELLALIGAVAGYLLLDLASGNRAAAAYGAAVGDNLGYYGLLAAREAIARIRSARPESRRERLRVATGTLRVLALEFGPAEAIDSTLVRPACTAMATAALGPAAGVLAAKLLADLAFYVPVIATYELRVRRAIPGDD